MDILLDLAQEGCHNIFSSPKRAAIICGVAGSVAFGSFIYSCFLKGFNKRLLADRESLFTEQDILNAYNRGFVDGLKY